MKYKEKILVIGGGFGGARVVQELNRYGFKNITLVDRKDYFDVTYAALRGVVEPEKWGLRSRKRYKDFLNGDFVQASMAQLNDHEAITENGTKMIFDIAVIATGSSYPTFSIAKSNNETTLQQREDYVKTEHRLLEKAKTVLIIGGGPVGVEFAGEIASFYKGKKITLIHDKNRLLNGFSGKCAKIAQNQLNALGIDVILSEVIEKTENNENLYFSKKTDAFYDADRIYICAGTRTNASFMKKNHGASLDESGFIKVDRYLRVDGCNHIYAIGDCTNFKEMKLGYLADIQGQKTAHNILRHVMRKTLKPYKRHTVMGLIPTGRITGVVQLPIGVSTVKFLVNLKQKDLFIRRVFKNFGTTPVA